MALINWLIFVVVMYAFKSYSSGLFNSSARKLAKSWMSIAMKFSVGLAKNAYSFFAKFPGRRTLLDPPLDAFGTFGYNSDSQN